jgi:chemotaxis protein MotB
MVTLLLTFFILLFSMSSLDSAKFNMLVTAFSNKESSDQIVIDGQADAELIGGDPITSDTMSELAEIYEQINEMIQQQNLTESVSVSQGDGYVFIQFMNNMLFQPNSAVLNPNSEQILNFVGESIKTVQEKTNSINIVGHTAAIPGDPDYSVSDRVLSSDRANAVLMFFEDTVGIDPTKLFATGYGKWKPLPGEDNMTEESRQHNRRVEILIRESDDSLNTMLDNIYEQLVD